MKLKFISLFCCILFSITVFSQVKQINGVTRGKTSVYFGAGNKSVDKLPSGTNVEIIDSDDTYFTIKYGEGKAYVIRTDIKFSYADLKELQKSKKEGLLTDYNVSNQQLTLKSTDPMTFKADLSKIDDKYKYEIDHIRYCAGKYNREIMGGYGLTFIGAAIVIGGSTSDKPEPTFVIGGVVSLIGTFMVIDSQKWMKRMYVGPNGMGIRFTF
ncbi:MAG: hypothetical protein JZU49_00995 [Sulfuricurvum sp.]|nr:hypothetical protein [Sulfuricurvum sp.]